MVWEGEAGQGARSASTAAQACHGGVKGARMSVGVVYLPMPKATGVFRTTEHGKISSVGKGGGWWGNTRQPGGEGLDRELVDSGICGAGTFVGLVM